MQIGHGRGRAHEGERFRGRALGREPLQPSPSHGGAGARHRLVTDTFAVLCRAVMKCVRMEHAL